MMEPREVCQKCGGSGKLLVKPAYIDPTTDELVDAVLENCDCDSSKPVDESEDYDQER